MVSNRTRIVAFMFSDFKFIFTVITIRANYRCVLIILVVVVEDVELKGYSIPSLIFNG